jgi:DNA-binding NarL/FixJ family response regulator
MIETPPRSAVLFDPHPLWLDAIERLLDRIGFSVVGSATAPTLALELVDEHQPDVIVVSLDLGATPTECVDVVRQVTRRAPRVKVIAVSADDSPELVDAALSAGAVAYIVKTAQADDVAAAIRQSFDQSVYLATGRANGMTGGSTPVAGSVADAAATEAAGLTRRELEILRLVAEGHSNASLAKMLWVTEQTVKFHLSNVYRKLDVSNRTEASRWAQVQGLLSAPADATAAV